MTVMLLQRFASPQTNQSPKANDGIGTPSGALSSTLGSGTFVQQQQQQQQQQSTSPSVTSLSTPSPTPLPFLFLLESQESWEEDQDDVPSINSETCTLPTESCPSSVDYPSLVYTRFTRLPVPGGSETLIINNEQSSNVGTSATRLRSENNKDLENENENENNNFTLRNNKNNYTGSGCNNNNNNNNQTHNNNNNNRRNSRNAYRGNPSSFLILSELEEYEKSRRKSSIERGEFSKEKSGTQGWIAGAEAPGSGAPGTLGGVRDCSVGIAAAAGSCSVTGGASGGGVGVCGTGSSLGRLGGQGVLGLASENSSFPADSRIGGGAGAVAACPAATAASNASTCGPVAGLTRLDSQGVAMRYYRLWIYACNIVLLGSAVGFAAAVSRTLLFTGDPRRYLVPGVPRALDPTALYAYLALATQLGLVQLLGCIAARRLSAKLLNAYWMLLLALLFGDAVIGVAWVFRFGRMRTELRSSLRVRLQLEYGKDNRFSEHWDRLQRDFSCCGIAGHEDFEATNLESLPPTCCPPNGLVPTNNSSTEICQQPWPRGCEDSLVDWLRKTADLLFVLGICVIAFAKLCFLGILRYEIREMIQKIRLLREPPLPPPSAIIGGSSSILCTSPPFVQSFSQLGVSPVVDSILTTTTNTTHINNNNNNNTSSNNNNAGVGAGPRRTTLPMAALPSGNSSILQQSDDYSGVRHPLLSSTLQDGGADSDTNSHCALILEETTPPSISGGCTANTRPDKSNGNNNYEMREFNRRLLISNGGTPGNLNPVARNRRT